jgi:glycosyltransferase involved in cell wall biosynthesis
LRLGINAYFLRHPATGSGQYLKHLVRALVDLGDTDSVLLVSPHATGSAARSFPAACLVREASTPFSGRHEQLDKVWFEQFSVPRACQSAGADVVHYPYFAAPLRSGRPVVVTVHDLIPLLMPPYRGGPLAQAYTRLATATARRATAIIADSECSRRDIVRLLNVPEDRVTVIYLAADERFKPMAEAEVAPTRRRHGLDCPFVLYLGGIDCRKNAPRLLEAFAALLKSGEQSLPADLTLAVAGDIPSPSAMFPDVRGQVAAMGLRDRVKFIGRVSEEDAPALYNAAEVFVFPSLYEGFGLPPLEAMACGTPVVCSNTSSLPEVVGDAAITVDPEDVGALAEALRRALLDVDLRRERRERGLRRAAQFNWHKTAVETLRVYQRALGRA